MNLDDVKQVLRYGLGKKQQIEAGKAVAFVAAHDDWADKRPAFADAIEAATLEPWRNGETVEAIGRAAVKAACMFIVEHS